MFLKIFALVKVVDEFDLKILANLVNILNHDDTKVRALRARASREREIFSRVCFLAFTQQQTFENCQFLQFYNAVLCFYFCFD